MEASWPEAGSVPVRREGASAVELDDNIALYDDVGQLMILLNSSAGAVWNLCDGSRTVGEMVNELAEAYPVQAEVMGDDVRQTLRKLAELGLVTAGPPAQ
ncbi:MAG TPA: PqqD family protein [Acidimicrobiales bacterium]|nr:PqqD family protein [Acidimicrobiales bacterium]